MQNLTTNQKSHLFEGGRLGVTITGETLDGDPIALTEDDIIEGSFSIERNWTSGNTIEIGCAETSELVFELDNFDGQWSAIRWEGARLTVVLDIDGEPLQAGIFTVDEPPKRLTTMQIRALDDMARFNRPYLPGIAYPATLRQILIDCCQQCGVALHTTEFVNDDYVVSQRPEGDDITFHHVVAWVAELAGCNAWIDHLARLRLDWYGESQAGDLEIGPDDRFSYEAAEADIEITGIIYRTDEVDYLIGDDRYALIIEGNPLLQDNHEAVLNVLFDRLGGFKYRPFRFEVLFYPHLWPGDKITKLIEPDGSELQSIITNHLFKLNGNSTLEARGETETVRGYATGAPFTPSQKRVLQAVAKIEAARQTSALEQAVLRLNELMVNSLGFYTTTVELETGAKIIYTHDKPNLEESQVIWTMTEQGFAWTDQGWQGGQPTWQYGVTADGSIVAKLLDVVGVRAEWVQVGSADDYISGKVDDAEQAARQHASDLLQSLADGTYSGGTFIDGKSIISPTVVGLQGTFAELMAGDPFGARLELGEAAGEPFLAAFDSATQRVKLEKDKIRFWDQLGRDGGKLSAERLIENNYDLAQLRLISPSWIEVGVLPPGVDPKEDYFRVGFWATAYDGKLSCHMGVISLGVEGWESMTSTVSCSNRGIWISPSVMNNQSVWFSQTDLRLTYPYPFDEREEEYYAIISTRPPEWGRKYLRLRADNTDTGGRINLYGERDPVFPGDVAIYTGDRETIRIFRDNRIRINPYSDGGYTFYFDRSGTYGGNSRPTLRPSADTYGFVGTSTHRFYQMFASGGFLTSSEKRLKTNIALADKASCYDQVKALRFKTYNLRGEIENATTEEDINTYLGIIAEEAPDIICDKEKKNINLYPYISLIGAAVQEIQGRLEAIEKQLAIGK